MVSEVRDPRHRMCESDFATLCLSLVDRFCALAPLSVRSWQRPFEIRRVQVGSRNSRPKLTANHSHRSVQQGTSILVSSPLHIPTMHVSRGSRHAPQQACMYADQRHAEFASQTPHPASHLAPQPRTRPRQTEAGQRHAAVVGAAACTARFLYDQTGRGCAQPEACSGAVRPPTTSLAYPRRISVNP